MRPCRERLVLPGPLVNNRAVLYVFRETMKYRIIIILFSFFGSVAINASQPHYYSFDKVHLTEGEITIEASTKSEGKLLETFAINTVDGIINLDISTLKKVQNPRLSTIKMSLMPYELEEGVRYFNEVSMTFYGDKICEPDANSLSGKWAPENRLVIVFWGVENSVRIETGQCYN